MAENIYPIAESFLISALEETFPDARVCTETPDNLADVLPCIQVVQISGSDPFPSFDDAIVDIDVYAATRGDARLLSSEVRTYLRTTLLTEQHDGVWALSVSTVKAATWTPYDNTNLRRFSASYRVRLHTR